MRRLSCCILAVSWILIGGETGFGQQVRWSEPQELPPPSEGAVPEAAKLRLPTLRLPVEGIVYALAFLDSTGHTLAVGSGGGEITCWDLRQRKILRTLKGHRSGVRSLAVSANGQLLASAAADGTVRLWRVATGDLVRVLEGHRQAVCTVTFQPQGQLLASAGDDPEIRLWNVETGQTVRQITGHGRAITGLTFSGDGRFLISACRNGGIRVWVTDTGSLQRSLGPGADRANMGIGVLDTALSPRGDLLAAGYSDGTLTLWDWQTGQERHTWRAHAHAIYTVAFSGDGKMLATAGYEETIRLWEVATVQERLRLRGHQDQVRTVTLAARGPALVSGAKDGQLLIWTVLPDNTTPSHRLNTAELERLWEDLARPQGGTAYQALVQLLKEPRSVDLLRDRLPRLGVPAQKKTLPQLLAELDNGQFLVREQAARDLLQHGSSIRGALRQHLANPGVSAEVRRRVEGLLLLLDTTTIPPEELRGLRAIELLERLATPEARQVLASLATGSAGTLLAEDARAALQRLGPVKP